MSDPLVRYGILGLGRSGWDIHVKALRPRSDAKIVAVCDPLSERREEAAAEFGCQTYSERDAMLARDDIDVVVVATPSAAHAPDTLAALRAGRHVACEKPMALNLADADAMIRTAQETNRHLFIHHNYRFMDEYQHMLQAVRSGLIGDLFHMRLCVNSMTRRYDWQTLSKNGGGTLNNTASHFIDMLLQILAPAKVTEVFGDMKQVLSAGDVEDHVKALMRADNGCTIDVEVSTAQKPDPAPPRWILSGTCGTLTCMGKAESTVHYFDPAQVKPLEAIDGPVLSRSYERDALPLETRQITMDDTRPVGNFYDAVAATVLLGAPLAVTPESVRETMRVMSLIRRGTAFEANQ